MNSDTKYVFILPGGGFRGSFQVGAIEAFLNEGIVPSAVFGTSVGALNAIFLAMDQFQELKALWNEVYQFGYEQIWKSWLVKEKDGKLKVKLGGTLESLATGGLFSRKGLGDLDPLREKLTRYVKKSAVILPCRSGVFSLTTGKYYSVSTDDCPNDESLVNLILASANMPLIWEPVPEIVLKNQTLTQVVDGGLQSVTPLKEGIDFINLQPDPENWKIVIIHCNTGTLEEHPEEYKLLGIAGRTLDVLLNNVFRSDLNRFELINQLVKASGKSHLNGYRVIESWVINPEPNTLGSTLDSRPSVLQNRFNRGYRLARQLLTSLAL